VGLEAGLEVGRGAAGSPVGAPHSQLEAANHLAPEHLSEGQSRPVEGSLGGDASGEARANTQAVARALYAHRALRSGAGLQASVQQA